MSQSIARFRIVGICRGSGVPGVAALALALVAGCGSRPGDLRNLSATVSGLEGSGLVLQVNSTDVAVSKDGPVTLGSLPSGSNYQVSVKTQPSNPTQTCTVGSPTGTVAGVDVTDVTVTCVTTRGVGGVVTGLIGTGLVLHSNLGDDLLLSADGPFVFPGRFRAGERYLVTVGQQPSAPLQTCSVENAEGDITSADVLDLKVVCSTKAFAVGGTVSGLEGRGLVLRDNGSDDRQVPQDGTFEFGQAVADGATYEVTVAAQPTDPWQTCTIEGGRGGIAGVPVSSVHVSCVTNRYAVVGTVSGLAGTGLILSAGGQDFPVTPGSGGGATPIVFGNAFPSGSTYEVVVKAQPKGPVQTCLVERGAGLVRGADVADIEVRCSTNAFAVGGTVSGLAGAGLVLRNGAELLAVVANGSFTFKNAVTDLGSYAVTVETNPTNPWQTCTVGATGSGQVSGGSVTAVRVTCATNRYDLSATVSGLTGTGLVLQLNSGGDIEVKGNGTVALGSLPSGAQYSVTVKTQPKSPVRSCTVGNANGVVGGSDVSGVGVRCDRVKTCDNAVLVNGDFESELDGWCASGDTGIAAGALAPPAGSTGSGIQIGAPGGPASKIKLRLPSSDVEQIQSFSFSLATHTCGAGGGLVVWEDGGPDDDAWDELISFDGSAIGCTASTYSTITEDLLDECPSGQWVDVSLSVPAGTAVFIDNFSFDPSLSWNPNEFSGSWESSGFVVEFGRYSPASSPSAARLGGSTSTVTSSIRQTFTASSPPQPLTFWLATPVCGAQGGVTVTLRDLTTQSSVSEFYSCVDYFGCAQWTISDNYPQYSQMANHEVELTFSVSAGTEAWIEDVAMSTGN